MLLFYCLPIFAQGDYKIEIEILDSLLVKNKRQQAVKVNVIIKNTQYDDTLYLYKFNKVVHTSDFVMAYLDLNLFNNSSVGLNFIITDLEGIKIQANSINHISYKKSETEIESTYKRIFINRSNLKIRYKLLKDKKQRDEYDIGKYIVTQNSQKLELYPLIDHYYNLTAGEYYLYFVYSYSKDKTNKHLFNNICSSENSDDNKVFNGSFVSNKVKLIIK